MFELFSKKSCKAAFCVIYYQGQINRGIAQLVEQWSPKPRVLGSSPSAPAKKKAIRKSEWLFSVKFALQASEIATL